MALKNLFGKDVATFACGSACGSNDKPEEEKKETPSACGSACGAPDKKEEEPKPSACGSACGAPDKK